MTACSFLGTGALLSFVLLQPAFSQGVAAKLDQILIELREIRHLVDGEAPKAKAAHRVGDSIMLDVANAPMLGSNNAPVTVVLFTDFECPFCGRFYRDNFANLKKEYIDLDKGRFFSMDFPLGLHQHALLAAQSGRCASDQGEFWPMFELMQSHPETLDKSRLLEFAQRIGLKTAAFQECIESGRYESKIQKDIEYAMGKGIASTPSFIIGKSTATGVEGNLFVGAVPYDVFKKSVDQALTK